MVFRKFFTNQTIAAAIPLGIGLSGYLIFICWFFYPLLGAVVSGLIIFISFTIIFFDTQSQWKLIQTPIIIALTFSLLYVSIVGDHGGLNDANNLIAHRYWVSIDNKIPMFFSDKLILGKEYLRGFLFGDWHSSDRPPLQSGIMMLIYPLAHEPIKELLAFILGLNCNVLWVFGLYAFMKSVGFENKKALLILVCVGLLGPVFVNTVYVWPKFLAASFSLCAFSVLIDKGFKPSTALVLAGLFSALSLLSHGAAIFGLIALVPFVFMSKDLLNVRLILIASSLALLMFLPWIFYQKFFDPPGNRLTKWHLAGQISESNESLMALIGKNYSNLGIDGSINAKMKNVAVFSGLLDASAKLKANESMPGWQFSIDGRFRQAQLFSFLISPLMFLFGLAFISKASFPQIKSLWVTTIFSSLFFLIAEFGGNSHSLASLHVAPMAIVFLWSVLCVSLCFDRYRVIRLIFSINILFFIWFWIIRTSNFGAALDLRLGERSIFMTVVQIALTSVLCLIFWKCTRSFDNSSASIPVWEESKEESLK